MINIDLTGKVALVTGSSSELGRVISTTLAESGADVVLHYFNSKVRALEVQEKIQKLGRRSWVVQADLTSEDQVKALKSQLDKESVVPDILVTNAVTPTPWKPVLEQPVEDYNIQFRSSAIQNVLMAQAFAPAMVQKKWGRIIGISTECVMRCLVTQSAYVGGKRGMDGILRVLAREIGEHGVTVNQVSPGWTISERDRINGTESQPHYDRDVPLKHRGEDRDIANAVAFLASDLAKFITGLYMPVCGGNIMTAV